MEVDIPADVVVRCPITEPRFSLRQVRKCDGCPHFGGLTDMLGNDARPFHQRFAVNCRFGIDRELQRLEQ